MVLIDSISRVDLYAWIRAMISLPGSVVREVAYFGQVRILE